MLLLEDVVVQVEARRLLDRASLVVPRGACVTIVTDDVPAGRVVLELLSGKRRPTTGRVRVDGHDPAANPALEGRIRAASIRDGAGAIRQFAIDRGVDVWLLDATSASAMDLEPVLHLLQRAGALGNPTVVVLVDPTEVPETGRVLHLRHGRLVQASPAAEPETGPRPPTGPEPADPRPPIDPRPTYDPDNGGTRS